MSKENNATTNEEINPYKEDDTMIANTVLKIDNNYFNEFLKLNKAKIENITPKNPTISKEDEWYSETFWDTDYKESNDK